MGICDVVVVILQESMECSVGHPQRYQGCVTFSSESVRDPEERHDVGMVDSRPYSYFTSNHLEDISGLLEAKRRGSHLTCFVAAISLGVH